MCTTPATYRIDCCAGTKAGARARSEASEANLKANAKVKDYIATLRMRDDDAAFHGIRKYRRSSVDALEVSR